MAHGASSRTFFTDGNLVDKVEHCVFPGIDDCAELPSGLPAQEILREGATLVHFASRTHEIRFNRCWASKPCEELLVAFVWHTICEHFKKDAGAQDELFSKLATSYATLFGTVVKSTEAKDAVSWYLPEALAHAACLALLAAFPRSKNSFDVEFRRKLFGTFVRWTSGFAGQRALDGDAAIAARAERAGGGAGASGAFGAHSPDGGGGGSGGNGGGNGGGLGGGGGGGGGRVPRLRLSKLLDEQERAACGAPTAAEAHRDDAHGRGRREAQRESCLVRALPAARRERKNLSACSPLMARWAELQHRHGQARGGTTAKAPNVIRISDCESRWLEETKLAASGAQTYRDVRREATKRNDRWMGAFNRRGAEIAHELATARHATASELEALKLERKAVLEREKDVHELANLLVSLRAMDDEQSFLVGLAS